MLTTSVLGQSLKDLSFGTDNTFEVITWNIEWFPNNGQTTADSVAQIMTALDADVYAIQEIDDTTLFRQTIDNLADYELFIHPGYFAGLCYVYNTTAVSIDSIYKIYDTPTYWHNFPRAPLVMELKFGGEKIIIINNHWKCCGDGVLNVNSINDEETRRYYASSLLKTYIDSNFQQQRVILTGDLNDILTDAPANNVFQNFIDDSTSYQFADMDIATGSTGYWSYPSWPSHLDHMLMSGAVIAEFADSESDIQTLKIEHNLAFGWSWYNSNISDHRPVALKLKINTTQTVGAGVALTQAVESYPNPAVDHTIIKFQRLAEEGRVEVLSANGQLIYSRRLSPGQSTATIRFPNFAVGIYLVRVRTEDAVVGTTKLVIR